VVHCARCRASQAVKHAWSIDDSQLRFLEKASKDWSHPLRSIRLLTTKLSTRICVIVSFGGR
jgi:hypothetical protein